jgi:outer membrane protein
VQVNYPLGKSAAKASLARTQLQHQQARLQLQNLELQVGTQVRDVARSAPDGERKRLAATRSALALAEKRLEAEQKKFGVGMSTSFLVFQAQRDLALARSNELQARRRLLQGEERLRGGAGDVDRGQ